MKYFGPEFLKFFHELRENNHKQWFEEHKAEYEKYVKVPFLEFVKQALNALNDISPFMIPDPKKCIFRINRDVRFSSDKSPYKTNVSAILGEGGTKFHDQPSFYIDFSDKAAYVGGGAYFIDNKKLPLVREFIAEHYKEFSDIIGDSKFVSYYHKVEGEANKKLMGDLKGLEAEYPLILKKQFYFMRLHDPEILLKSDLMDIVSDGFKAGLDCNHFMMKALESTS